MRIESPMLAFAPKHGHFPYRHRRIPVTGDDSSATTWAMHDGRTAWFDDLLSREYCRCFSARAAPCGCRRADSYG
jgi:hypothetical protein